MALEAFLDSMWCCDVWEENRQIQKQDHSEDKQNKMQRRASDGEDESDTEPDTHTANPTLFVYQLFSIC